MQLCVLSYKSKLTNHVAYMPKMKFPGQGSQKLEPEQDRHTDTDTRTDVTESITTPHSRVTRMHTSCAMQSFL